MLELTPEEIMQLRKFGLDPEEVAAAFGVK